MRYFSLTIFVLGLLSLPFTQSCQAIEHQIDAVVASVNGDPISLRELSSHLPGARTLTLQEAASDPEARAVLDDLIMQRVISLEAQNRKISVRNEEIEEYLNEVARRNHMARVDFEKALGQQGKKIDDYKEQVRGDILRSRLASSAIQGAVSVTDKEVDEYIGEHPELSKSGAKLKLARIVVLSATRGIEAAKQRAAEAKTKLDGGATFANIAREYSDGPEAADGGEIGVVAEEDLSHEIFDVLFQLKDDQVSEIKQLGDDFHIYKVEARFIDQKSENDKLKDEVRKIVQEQKMHSRMQTYFTVDLYRNYSVDKKI